MMIVNIHLTHLFSLLALLTGVCPQTLQEIYVKAGEMVALQCPHYKGYNYGKVTWTTQEMDLTTMSSAEQRKMGVLVHERSLVILRASINCQGNYSCSQGSTGSQFWFRLTVYTRLSREYEERIQYNTTCYTKESCTLYCPTVNIPAANIPNITRNDIIWHKEGESLREETYFFSRVEEKNHGVYTCTRSYLYLDQIYNMSFPMVLDVKPKNSEKYAVIKSPRKNDVVHVDLGSLKVIDCKVDLYSDFDEVFWLSGNSFVETDDNFSVFYNSTWNNDTKQMTASLVFKKVSKEDLSKHYTCKLESASQLSSFVTITLAQKTRPFPILQALVIMGIVVAIAVTIVAYVKLKKCSFPAGHSGLL